jgi:hypothetical protein
VSVYKPKNSRIWQFDFIIDGTRHHGSTGVLTRRAAEEVERRKRNEAATGQLGQIARMTLDAAAGRYWEEKGKARGDAEDVERRIALLLVLLGKNTHLGDINQAEVAKAIQRRRGMTFKKGKDRKGAPAKTYALSESTVNRDVVDTLRPILRRARSHWAPKGSGHGLPDIDWRELRLTEPRALSRIYSAREHAAWLEACDDDVRLALEMMLTYGLRYGELFFPLDALNLDPEEPTLTLQKGRKRDVILHLPLRRDHSRVLAARVSQARKADLEHVWYARRGKKLVALTYWQVEGRISKAADAAGISGGRRIHGTRHHAGSAILKRTRNLKAVQSLLGHATINSSQRYAHVLLSDLREALEDEVPRNSPEAVDRRDPKAEVK